MYNVAPTLMITAIPKARIFLIYLSKQFQLADITFVRYIIIDKSQATVHGISKHLMFCAILQGAAILMRRFTVMSAPKLTNFTEHFVNKRSHGQEGNA